MKIELDRMQTAPDFTLGALTVDNEFECWVIEDAVREIPGQPVSAWKVAGKTAIPRGTYKVDVTMSARFKRELPLLLDVPGFAGIRIHPGNTAEDTEGCLLPGLDRHGSSVGRSRKAFDDLFIKIMEAKRKGESIWIEVA